MFLRELFDRSAPYEWITQIPNDRYVARFNIGENEYKFSAHIFPYDNLRGAEISFCMMDGKKCRTDNTGSGNVNLVYSTVIQLVKEVVEVLKISRIAYDADDAQRKRIYAMIISKSLPDWKLVEHDADWFYYDRPIN